MALLVDKIDRMGFVAEDAAVVLECRAGGRKLAIDFQLETFYRLIALGLKLAGRLPDTDSGAFVMLKPERIDAFALANGDISLQITLPGGAPLNFHLAADEARETATRLAGAPRAAIEAPRPN